MTAHMQPTITCPECGSTDTIDVPMHPYKIECFKCGNVWELSAQSRLAPASGSAASWQPIDTLPRDGTPVLVWARGMSKPDIAWQ